MVEASPFITRGDIFESALNVSHVRTVVQPNIHWLPFYDVVKGVFATTFSIAHLVFSKPSPKIRLDYYSRCTLYNCIGQVTVELGRKKRVNHFERVHLIFLCTSLQGA